MYHFIQLSAVNLVSMEANVLDQIDVLACMVLLEGVVKQVNGKL